MSLRTFVSPILRRFGFALIPLAVLSVAHHSVPAQEAETGRYHTPYRIEYSTPREELIRDLLETERGSFEREAEIPHSEWYSRRVRERWGAWGPVARKYPPFHGLETWSTQMLRERVVAVATRYLGYGYQHHHIPNWSPSSEWPWLETCVGHNGRGVDCSNFTGFVYNQGFGLWFGTEVVHQSESEHALGPGPERRTPVERIELAANYADRIAQLRTGDLLFIRSDRGNISHVVIWVGAIGQSEDQTPLIIDSHGAGVKDSKGEVIPCGVHIRPFRENSWYNRSASHALRVFRD